MHHSCSEFTQKEKRKQVLQQEAYPAIRPPVDAQNSAISGAIELSDTPLEPSFVSEYFVPRLYVPV